MPCFMAFFCAIFRAGFEISVAWILASGSSNFRVIAIQPEPVPISRILGVFGSLLLFGLTPGKYDFPARFKTASIICSVSGRGARTSFVIIKSRP